MKDLNQKIWIVFEGHDEMSPDWKNISITSVTVKDLYDIMGPQLDEFSLIHWGFYLDLALTDMLQRSRLTVLDSVFGLYRTNEEAQEARLRCLQQRKEEKESNENLS